MGWLGQIIDLRKRGWYLWMWGRDTPMPTVIILPHLELSRIDLPKLMKWEIRSFLGPKGSLKDDIYWLLKRSCFELFGDGKYDLFSVKKFMERWYLLVTEKFLYWTFRGWEIRSFFQSKSWWKDYIYLVI